MNPHDGLKSQVVAVLQEVAGCGTEGDGKHRKKPSAQIRAAPFNEQAYQRGVAHANTADLSTGVANSSTSALA